MEGGGERGGGDGRRDAGAGTQSQGAGRKARCRGRRAGGRGEEKEGGLEVSGKGHGENLYGAYEGSVSRDYTVLDLVRSGQR